MIRPGAALLLALLAGAAALPLATGQPAPERHAVDLSILEWHPYPDPDAAAGIGGDPFGLPHAPGASEDRMRAYYGASWFPTTWFDGVLESSYERGAPLDDLASFRAEYEARVRERLAEDSPLVLVLNATADASGVNVTLRATPKVAIDSDRLAVRLVLFEDDVAHDGGNGVPVHRFLVRHAFAPEVVGPLAAGETIEVHRSVPRPDPAKRYPDANWGEALGVVAFVQNEDPASPNWAAREVLQSATFLVGQDGPTVQARKSVLLEMYTAVWCASCVNGDGAVELLAAEYGVASARTVDVARAGSYLRAPTATQVALALAATGVLAIALWPRKGAA